MYLGLMSDNTIFRDISRKTKEKNIIYEPKYSLLDHIIYMSNDNYFILENNSYSSNIDNVLNIPNSHIEYYNYHFLMTHYIEKHLNDSFAMAAHLPTMFIIDQVKNYKKEDKHIIQQKMNNHTKIFLNQSSYEYYGDRNKSFLINLGIPSEIFNNKSDFSKRGDVIIFDYGSISQQLKIALEKEGLSCVLINTRINSATVEYLLNKYKVCIDISENYIGNLLVSLCCGCRAITTTNNPVVCPYIHHIDLNDNILSKIKDLIASTEDNNEIRQYIKDQYCFTKFQNSLHNIIQNISHEVYIR